MASFKVELSDEYYNVEFTGKDIRNWQKTNGGYVVQLHTPVAGPYTLLATYDRPFKSQGETLLFTGARPLDAQSEQGYTLVISAYQFQVKPTEVSPGLLPLEPGEVPPEYRLFFDAPILAAYRYASRPFNLQLALQAAGPGRFCQPDRGPRLLPDPHLQGGTGRDRRPLLHQKSRQSQFPPDHPRRGQVVVRFHQRRFRRPGLRRQGQPDPAAAERGPERRAGTGFETGRAIQGNPRKSHRQRAHRRRPGHAGGMEN